MPLAALDGKVAVVTGGASGIGAAVSECLAAQGMKVVLADIEQAALEATAQRMRDAGHDVLPVHTDVSSAEQVEALATATYERYGACHVLHNNAGVVGRGPAWEVSLEEWQWVMGVDLWSVVHGIRAFVPRMLEGGEPGHVVSTASTAGLAAFPGIAPYDVAKAGVVALSEALHHDLAAVGAGDRIGVSVLCPGVVPTRIGESARNRPGVDPGTVEQMVATQATPPPTAKTPAQVADAVLDAITTGRFWILTHPEYRDVVQERAAAILDGFTVVRPPVL
jgi:NAD(P)-dependent dehydrogenase (short-subunit alcohol dehydrogenase family)